MGLLARGDIVLVRFPFSDLRGANQMKCRYYLLLMLCGSQFGCGSMIRPNESDDYNEASRAMPIPSRIDQQLVLAVLDHYRAREFYFIKKPGSAVVLALPDQQFNKLRERANFDFSVFLSETSAARLAAKDIPTVTLGFGPSETGSATVYLDESSGPRSSIVWRYRLERSESGVWSVVSVVIDNVA